MASALERAEQKWNRASRSFGPDLHRDAVANVERACFRIAREESVTLELLKVFEGLPC